MKNIVIIGVIVLQLFFTATVIMQWYLQKICLLKNSVTVNLYSPAKNRMCCDKKQKLSA
jgi:hypothetical protein